MAKNWFDIEYRRAAPVAALDLHGPDGKVVIKKGEPTGEKGRVFPQRLWLAGKGGAQAWVDALGPDIELVSVRAEATPDETV